MNEAMEMNTESAEGSQQNEHPPRTVTVTVNNRPVTFSAKEATGSEIKQTAIAQHVSIQADFALFEVKGQGNLKQIGDHELVKLHPHQEFRAVGPDDNS